MAVKKVCATCGSEEVLTNAWAEWDVASQQYVLQNVFDASYCEECDGECSVEDVEVDIVEYLKSGD